MRIPPQPTRHPNRHDASAHHPPPSIRVPLKVSTTAIIGLTLSNVVDWIRTRPLVWADIFLSVPSSSIKLSQEAYHQARTSLTYSYRFLRSVAAHERRARREPNRNRISHNAFLIGQTLRNKLTATRQSEPVNVTSLALLPSSTNEDQEIAAAAGLRLEDVPFYALKLKGTVRGATACVIAAEAAMMQLGAGLALWCYKTAVWGFGLYYVYLVGWRRGLNTAWALVGLFFLFEIRAVMDAYWQGFVEGWMERGI